MVKEYIENRQAPYWRRIILGKLINISRTLDFEDS